MSRKHPCTTENCDGDGEKMYISWPHVWVYLCETCRAKEIKRDEENK